MLTISKQVILGLFTLVLALSAFAQTRVVVIPLLGVLHQSGRGMD
jgi:hypothetical protein